MKKPQFKSEGFCRKCGQKTQVSMSGLCEGCWDIAKREQIKKNRKNRETNLKTKASYQVTNSIQERLNSGEKMEDILKSLGIQVPAGSSKKKAQG